MFFSRRLGSTVLLFSTVLLLILLGSAAASYYSLLFDEVPPEVVLASKSGLSNPYRDFNAWINSFLFNKEQADYMISLFGQEFGYYVMCYIRDLFLGTLVYWCTAGIWHIVIYKLLGNAIFSSKKRQFPTFATMADQMVLAQSSLFLYAMLPIISEFLIENRITRCYFYLDEIGGFVPALLYFILYIVFVEIGVYWMHRTLHTNKTLYTYIHSTHHKYNKALTLTPWASIAFNPIDGILQVRYNTRYIFI